MKKINGEKDFLEEKYKELLDKMGIILLRDIDYSTREQISEFAMYTTDMAAFPIFDPETRQMHMVLRYKHPIFTKIDFKKLYNEANTAYVDGDYELCLNKYIKALQMGKSNNLTYAIMGFTLGKLGRYSEAIDYLTVANCMPSNRKLGYNFTNTIKLFERLNNNEISDSKKENLLMRTYESVLIDGKIVLISSLSDKQIESIEKRISDYPGMECFDVEIDGERSIVFKEKTPIYIPAIDTATITNEAESDYLTGSYDEAISKSKKLILVTRPNSYIFSRLGLAYARKKELRAAIDILKIAKGLSIKENQKLSSGYDGIITDLEDALTKENRSINETPSCGPSEEIDTNYVINYFDNIKSTIASSGLGISDACDLMGITGEALDVLRLLYARDFYIEGQDRIADAFIKKVEHSEFKTDFTDELRNEIHSCRMLYPKTKKLSE